MRNRTRVPTLINVIQHSIRRPHRANRGKSKSHTNWKDRSKIVPVCRHGLIYIENPKGFITTLLEVINSMMLKNTK